MTQDPNPSDRTMREAGVALYQALQGDLENCPFCKSSTLQHKDGCPVDDYMRACKLGPYRV